MTVSWRRSASGDAERERAVAGGREDWGARRGLWAPLRVRLLAGESVPAAPRVVPQSAQNLACGRLSNPQPGQECLTAPPHSIQNLAPSGFSKPQLPQRIQLLYSLCPDSGKRNA